MCGIVGIISYKRAPLGRYMIQMLSSLQHRGEDSAGVAMYWDKKHTRENEFIVRMLTKDIIGSAGKISTAIAASGGNIRKIKLYPIGGYSFDRYVVKIPEENLERLSEEVRDTKVSEVLSIGRWMEIVKDVGWVRNLDDKFDVSNWVSTHGIGHVRFSTESSVDLLHAHPFQSFSYPDMAVVENGQITNYYKVRNILAKKGHKFYTENDAELIVHYVAELIGNGATLDEALSQSVEELDGPFTYIISTANEIGVVRDKLGLRPGVIMESDSINMIASEEATLRLVGIEGTIRNLRPGEVKVWRVN